MKKVIIVGAGIAGMAAGIYALQSGFEVMLFEQHTIPGGNCTSWKRKGYLFEGGMHWLTGSDKQQPLRRLWEETGALTKDTKIHNRDPFITYVHNGQNVCLYRDLVKLQEHLCSISPEDSTLIRRLCRDVKTFAAMSMPIMNIPGLKVKTKEKGPSMLGMLLKMLPALLRMNHFAKQSIGEYVKQFKHPAIRSLLTHIAGEDYASTALMFTLACLSSGDGGYVEGGSLKMATNMANYFKQLGGTVQYGLPVEKITIEGGKATGVMVAGTYHTADDVIVASDTRSAIDQLFDQPLQEPWADNMRSNTGLANCTFISIGVEADLSHLPEAIIFSLDKTIDFAGKQINTISVNNYASYQGYAPQGGTALTLILDGNYEYWKTSKEDGSYEQRKQELIDQIIARLEEKLPTITGKLAVWDVATPLTYERYCGTYHGSWMTLMPPGFKQISYPSKSKNIDHLYFAGQRLQPPGGMPVALSTGRQAAQYLCKDNDVVFRNKM
jgi:phytoene dehydrogenase-like protein